MFVALRAAAMLLATAQAGRRNIMGRGGCAKDATTPDQLLEELSNAGTCPRTAARNAAYSRV